MLYIYKESNSRSKLGLFLMCSLNFGFAKYFVFSASTLNITSCAVVRGWILWLLILDGRDLFHSHNQCWDFKILEHVGDTCFRLLRQCLSARIRTSAAESGLTSVFNLWAQSCTWNWLSLDVLCPTHYQPSNFIFVRRVEKLLCVCCPCNLPPNIEHK